MRSSIPNLLTYSRILAIPAIVAAFWVQGEFGYLLSAGIFFYASVTDWLDGYLARTWKVTSRIGQFLDPIADKLLVATCLLLVVQRHGHDSPYLILPAIAILCREILVSGLREFLADMKVAMPVTKLAKYKTAGQMIAIFLLLLGPAGPAWLNALWLGEALLWVSAALTLFTGYIYLREGVRHM